MTAKVKSIAPRLQEGERKLFQELAAITATMASEQVSVYDYMQARAHALALLAEIQYTVNPSHHEQQA